MVAARVRHKPLPHTNMTQATLTVHDNPPMGVTVLSFEIEVTGAALQPSDSSKQPVSILSEPEDIELEHLQTESALLASKRTSLRRLRMPKEPCLEAKD